LSKEQLLAIRQNLTALLHHSDIISKDGGSQEGGGGGGEGGSGGQGGGGDAPATETVGGEVGVEVDALHTPAADTGTNSEK
jgi:hypothetical protein